MGKVFLSSCPRKYTEDVKFSRRNEGPNTVITVEGSILDLVSSSSFKKLLDDRKVEGACLLDFSHVEYIDSVIIGILVERFLAFRREGRRLVLFALQDSVVELLRTTSLLSVFDVEEGLDGALRLSGEAVDPNASVFASTNEEVA